MLMEIPASAHYHFHGPLGERVQANTDNWLLRAPVANPGMIEMFRRRDRNPVPELVPWAGEFIGKYLISAIQACRMTDDPRLKPFVAEVIAELISTQAEDGYLGPFCKEERLLGHWDLWGHYHAMLALLLWHERTGDEVALKCAVRTADLICRTFLGTERRVFDAGSQEMNMAVIHSLGWLYRVTGEERYLRMVRQIEKEWEIPGAGDYLRAALAGQDFWRTPKPRWESLHDLQGLVELHAITGDERYKQAFVQHWTSIRNYDRHPSGGFTTGERAIGNPYSDGAIETCCTTAWMALTVDMLRLTGDPLAADELELATWNSMLGSQHPSGRWWTYNTPVDGVREASAHTIVFQSRFGTPELNCCSVNAPRGLGMLSEWGVMQTAEGIAVNYYGPCEVSLKLPDGTPLRLRQETRYPAEAEVRLIVGLQQEAEFPLRLRIPQWSQQSHASVNGSRVEGVRPGTYLMLKRRWKDGDTVELSLDLSLRYWTGELSKRGKAALYRGPLLLAFDQKFNSVDTDAILPLDLGNLKLEPAEPPADCRFQPLVLLRVPTTTPENHPEVEQLRDGSAVRAAGAPMQQVPGSVVLCDFATAGAHGTDYRAWLPVVTAAPALFYLERPRDEERIAAGPALFEWTGYRSSAGDGRTFTLEIAKDEQFRDLAVTQDNLRDCRAVVREQLEPNQSYFWRVTATNPHGAMANALGPRRFTVDPKLPNAVDVTFLEQEVGKDGLMAASPLDGDGKPSFGVLDTAHEVTPAADRFGNPGKAVALNGGTSQLVYKIPYFPEEDYTACAWVCPEGLPTDRLHQVFSAWAVSMDDPLRITIQGDQVFARIEAGSMYGTAGVRLENGKWYHVAAVKQGAKLSLYVNGELKHTADVPEMVFSASQQVGVGTNPNYGGNERLQGKVDGFAFYAKALRGEEIKRLFEASQP
jgi:DUF1680 family protein